MSPVHLTAHRSLGIYIIFSLSLHLWKISAYGSHCDKFKHLCPNGTHTMCKYKETGEKCGKPGLSGITEDDKKEILDSHNSHRSFVAAGNETRGNPGPQPPAANMMKFFWDDELSVVAQRWADQCNATEDDCRDDPRGRVGQAVFYGPMIINWTEVINNWYNEVQWFSNESVSCYRSDMLSHHYSQIVWGLTYLVGCGKREYDEFNGSGSTSVQYVCNYYPAGNIINESVYINGTPCSLCPNGTFPEGNLCVNQTIINQMTKGFFGTLCNYLYSWFKWFMSLFGLDV